MADELKQIDATLLSADDIAGIIQRKARQLTGYLDYPQDKWSLGLIQSHLGELSALGKLLGIAVQREARILSAKGNGAAAPN